MQIIVVDNGSSDGSAQLDSEFPNLQWIRLPKNFGLTKAWNLGWRAADAEYVLFLHDDTEVEPDAVARLADALDANADADGGVPAAGGCGGTSGAAARQLSARTGSGVRPRCRAMRRSRWSIRAGRRSWRGCST